MISKKTALILSIGLCVNSAHAVKRMDRKEFKEVLREQMGVRRKLPDKDACFGISFIALALIATICMHDEHAQITRNLQKEGRCIGDIQSAISKPLDGCKSFECELTKNSFLNNCISPETNYSTVWVCKPGSEKLRELQDRLFETGRQKCTWHSNGKKLIAYASSKTPKSHQSHDKSKKTHR